MLHASKRWGCETWWKNPNLGKTTKKNNETSFFGWIYVPNIFGGGIYVPNSTDRDVFLTQEIALHATFRMGFFPHCHFHRPVYDINWSAGKVVHQQDLRYCEYWVETTNCHPTDLFGWDSKPTNGTRLAPRICQVPSRQEIHQIASQMEFNQTDAAQIHRDTEEFPQLLLLAPILRNTPGTSARLPSKLK